MFKGVCPRMRRRQVLSISVKSDETLGGFEEKAYLCNLNVKEQVMISKNVQEMIPMIQKFCGSQPIVKAWLFGSCSRGEESQDSDVDILVEYDRQNTRISLMKIAGMMLGLEDLLHRKVDLVEASRLLPFAQESVNHDKFLVYERES